MKVYLTKQNRKTTDFVLMEAQGHLVDTTTGKIGKSGIGRMTRHAGSSEGAIAEINHQISELTAKGFKVSDIPRDLVTKDDVFDKAKWHINDQFPKDLDHYQSYVHTGLYVAWLIENDLVEPEFKAEHLEGINKLLARQITPSKFYEQELDGVFDAEGLTQEAIKFTTIYFDFEKGLYIRDYLSIFDPNQELPSLFHVADTWDNYDKLVPTIRRKFNSWNIRVAAENNLLLKAGIYWLKYKLGM